MDKLHPMGIGPVIGGITLPWLVAAILIELKFKDAFNYFKDGNNFIFYTGLVLIIIGAIMYFLTAPALLRGVKETKLITGGPYYLCRNPLYASVILFIIPGISFMMNSWLVLTASIVAYTLFKIFIKREYAEMEKFFDEDYRKYSSETPEFLPFPIKKLFHKIKS